jgi:hypothetical protein
VKPDRAWCEAVVAHLQPVFDEDGSDWSFHGIADPPEALLWEASPTAFVARHPDAGIEESYGDAARAPAPRRVTSGCRSGRAVSHLRAGGPTLGRTCASTREIAWSSCARC